MYRYFRGMDCTDHLTSILFKHVPESEQQGRCVSLILFLFVTLVTAAHPSLALYSIALSIQEITVVPSFSIVQKQRVT